MERKWNSELDALVLDTVRDWAGRRGATRLDVEKVAAPHIVVMFDVSDRRAVQFVRVVLGRLEHSGELEWDRGYHVVVS